MSAGGPGPEAHGCPVWLLDEHRQPPRLVALDTTCFIHGFEAHPQFVGPVRGLFRAIEGGVLRATAAALTLTEVLTLPLRERALDLAEGYRSLLMGFPNLDLVSMTPAVASRAAELRARFGLRTPDALHIACALEVSADAFVTADRRLSVVTDLRVVQVPASPTAGP